MIINQETRVSCLVEVGSKTGSATNSSSFAYCSIQVLPNAIFLNRSRDRRDKLWWEKCLPTAYMANVENGKWKMCELCRVNELEWVKSDGPPE